MKKVLNNPFSAMMTALTGLLFYIIQLTYYAITQISVLDEGGYLYSGFLMSSTDLRPFQDFGVYSYNMPIGFLVPGFLQSIFGAGIRTGRIYAVLLAIMIVIVLWVVTRRLAGDWPAALLIWAFPLSPLLAKVYSQAVTQVIAAAILVWILFLVLGEDRPRWQIILGGALTGLLIMVRLNMAPLLIFIPLYLWWARDFKTALYNAVAGGVVLLVIHGVYFPNILRLWAFWLPPSIFTFLQPYAEPAFELGSWIAPDSLWTSLSSILFAVRYHLLTVVSVIISLALWPHKSAWRSEAHYKIGVLLAGSWIFLFFLHLVPTSFGTHCVFCLNSYMPFFTPLAWLLFALVLAQLPQLDASKRDQKIRITGLFTLMSAGLVIHPILSKYIIGSKFVRNMMSIEVPRVSSAGIAPGKIPIWGLLENFGGLNYNEAALWTDRVLSLITGALFGILVWAMLYWLTRIISLPNNTIVKLHGAIQHLLSILLILAVLSPTFIYSGATYSQDCTGNSIAGYEHVGEQLAEIIPPGAHIYWEGGRTPVVMLYLPGRTMSPAQMFNAYTFKFGGDPEELLRYGYYNEDLAAQWIRTADYILVEEDLYRGWIQEELESDAQFVQIAITDPTVQCMPTSQIIVYQYQP